LNKYLKNTTGIIFVLIVTVITLIFLFNSLTSKSYYKDSGTISIKGISKDVNVYKDNFGVPQISAENDDDIYFAMGYMHAKDRLWQMDLSRRAAEGRMSEILGKETLEFDKLFRIIGIGKYAENLYTQISPKSKKILNAYSNGVNYFIQNNNSKLPLEFDVLDYKPEPWKPEHSLEIIRMMGWELNFSWYCEYVFGEIVKKFGTEKAKDFFPDYDEKGPFIIKNEKEKKTAGGLAIGFPMTKSVSHSGNTGSATFGINKQLAGGNDGAITERTRSRTKFGMTNNFEENDRSFAGGNDIKRWFVETNLNYREFFNLKGSHIGSNSWVVNGKKSESGKPLLANDPHLYLQMPSRWYEAGFNNKETGLSASGFTIPGAPGIAIGRNNYISWGITNLMNDDLDFVILKPDSANSSKYLYNGNSYYPDSTLEYIKIKGIKDEYALMVYMTKSGPLISGIEKAGFISDLNFKSGGEKFLTFRWTGFEASDETEAFYNINHAKNWNEFRNGLKNFGLPASNFVYADTEGNIGYQAAGLVPLRKKAESETEHYTPVLNQADWQGFIPFDELPQVYNPPEDFIVTANNKPLKDYKYYITNFYEAKYRAERIEQILRSRNKFNSDEFKLIQSDVMSLQAKEFCGYLFEAFKDSLTLNPGISKYLSELKKWDYDMKPYSIPAAIFSQFEIQLYKNLYKEILGNELFNRYIFIENVPVRNTSKLLQVNNSWILDRHVQTGKIENRDAVLKKSFIEAIEVLKARFASDDMNKWLWGEMHRIILRHPLGVVPALSTIVNIGPFETGGSGTTINLAEYSFIDALEKNSYESFIGPSMRFIVDMSNPKHYFSILAGGESGQPLHPNSGDQARMWLNGENKKVVMDINEILKQVQEDKVGNILRMKAER